MHFGFIASAERCVISGWNRENWPRRVLRKGVVKGSMVFDIFGFSGSTTREENGNTTEENLPFHKIEAGNGSRNLAHDELEASGSFAESWIGNNSLQEVGAHILAALGSMSWK